MKKWIALLFVVLIVGGAGFICVKFYEFVFAKNISGEIVKVERVAAPGSIIASGRAIPAEQLFSFGVAIRDEKGEIHTASSEDRQWSVAQPGQCAEARFFPYPPWDLESSGTFHNARLLRLYDCPGKPPQPAPAGSPKT